MELTTGERNSLEREFKWLLQEEMPNLVVQLHKILSDCSNKFFKLDPEQIKKILEEQREECCKPAVFDNLKSAPGIYVLTNRNNAENFKGVVTLFQNLVVSADLQIKLPTAVQTLRANIREDNPWKVSQIQACSNLLTKMLALLTHHTSNAISYTHSSQIIKLLDQLTGLLNSARKTLDNPPNIDIDTILQDRQKVVFNPPLPSEFSVVFTILRDRLLVNAFHIQPQKTPDNRKVDLRQAMSVGRVEIASRASESSPVPWLTTLIMSISFCLEQSQLMKDKVTMFHQYNIRSITPAGNIPLATNPSTAAAMKR